MVFDSSLTFDYYIWNLLKMQYFKKFLIIASFLWFNPAIGQMGKSYKEIQKLYPNTIIALRNEGILLVEDKQITDKEVRMIMYNSDSIAVVIVLGFLDSTLTDSGLTKVLIKELPQFNKTKFAEKEGQILWVDTVNNFLLVLNSAFPGRTFPIAGLAIVTEPNYITFWLEGITVWKRE